MSLLIFTRFRHPGCWVLMVLASICGCSSANRPCSVSGTAAWEGTPIAKGNIRFVPHDGTPGPGGIGPIADGKYAVQTGGMLSGKYLVMVFAYRDTGRMSNLGDRQVPVEDQYLPAKFNSSSLEIHELKPGANTLDFTLQP